MALARKFGSVCGLQFATMRVLILLALVAAAIAAEQPRSQRVIGGVSTTIEKYPFLANLMYWTGNVWFQGCAGSILTTKTILSAAHCFQDEFSLPSVWRIRVGSSFASSGGTVLNPEKFICHEDYEEPTPLNNDVAIILLATPAVYSGSVSNIRISGPNYHLPIGTQVTTMGWGRLIWGGAFPEQLQEVDIDIFDQELCHDRYEALRSIPTYSYFPAVTDKMICAAADRGYKDSCSGDSGGPVVHNGDIAIGIVSWAYGCGDPWYPGVSVRVSAFTNWIIANSV